MAVLCRSKILACPSDKLGVLKVVTRLEVREALVALSVVVWDVSVSEL